MLFSYTGNWFLSVDSLQNLVLKEKNVPPKFLAERVTSFDGLCRSPQRAEVFFTTEQGSLIHMKLAEGKNSSVILMTSKNPKRKICCVNVIEINGRYHLFYCLDYENRYLIHQIISQGDSFPPEVVDTIGKHFIYSAVKDEDLNIHIVYETEGMLRYKKYVYAEKRYTTAENLYKASPRKLCADVWEDVTYVAFTENVGEMCRLYLLKVSGEMTKKSVMTVGRDSDISLNCGKNGIRIHVAEVGVCYEIESDYNLEAGKPKSIGKSYGIAKVRFCDESNRVRTYPVNRFMLPLEGYESFKCEPLKPLGTFAPVGAEAESFANRCKETFGEKIVNLEKQDISFRLGRIEASVKNLSDRIEKVLDELKKTQTPSE